MSLAQCRLHHGAYETGRLKLLWYLEPEWRCEVAHAVVHLGLIGGGAAMGAGSALSSSRSVVNRTVANGAVDPG